MFFWCLCGQPSGLCIIPLFVLGDPECSFSRLVCQGTSEPFLVAKSLKAIKIITAVPVLGFTRPSEPQGISGHHRLFEAWKGLNSGSSSGVRLFSIKFYLPLCQRTGSFLFLWMKRKWVTFFLTCESVSHSYRVWRFATLQTVARQAPLSMGFSRQEYWSGLPFPSPGDLPHQGSNPGLPHCRQILYRLNHQGSPLLSCDST